MGFSKIYHPLRSDVETKKRRLSDDSVRDPRGSSPDPPGGHGHCRDLAGGLALDGVWVAQDLSQQGLGLGPLWGLLWGALFCEKVEEWKICHPPSSAS